MLSPIDKLSEVRAGLRADLDALLAKDALTPEDEAAVARSFEEIEKTDARIADIRALEAREKAAAEVAVTSGNTGHEPRAVVTREERTYSIDKSLSGEASFFSDAFRSQQLGDVNATDRIRRHAQEAVVEGELTKRAVSTSGFAGLVVPQYLTDLAALALRNGRPVANVCQSMPLPDQGLSLIVPRGTTGAAVASQATENSSVQSTDEVWTNLTVPVVTIAGQQDVSRQSLERGIPGLDGLIILDLSGAYAAELDRQVLHGTGASNQVLGMTATSGIYAATAFGAAVSAANFTSKVAGAIQAIAGAGTAIQPRVIIMHPRRWGWLQSLTDSSGRPLALAQAAGPYNVAGLVTIPGGYSADGPATGSTPQIVGVMANGLPVITDANVTTTAGTINEDLVIVADTNQCILWEDGDGAPKQLRFEQTLGNQLTVKLVAYGYAAFTAGRYPGAVGKIGGLDTTTNGLVAPTF